MSNESNFICKTNPFLDIISTPSYIRTILFCYPCSYRRLIFHCTHNVKMAFSAVVSKNQKRKESLKTILLLFAKLQILKGAVGRKRNLLPTHLATQYPIAKRYYLETWIVNIFIAYKILSFAYNTFG